MKGLIAALCITTSLSYGSFLKPLTSMTREPTFMQSLENVIKDKADEYQSARFVPDEKRASIRIKENDEDQRTIEEHVRLKIRNCLHSFGKKEISYGCLRDELLELYTIYVYTFDGPKLEELFKVIIPYIVREGRFREERIRIKEHRRNSLKQRKRILKQSSPITNLTPDAYKELYLEPIN